VLGGSERGERSTSLPSRASWPNEMGSSETSGAGWRTVSTRSQLVSLSSLLPIQSNQTLTLFCFFRLQCNSSSLNSRGGREEGRNASSRVLFLLSFLACSRFVPCFFVRLSILYCLSSLFYLLLYPLSLFRFTIPTFFFSSPSSVSECRSRPRFQASSPFPSSNQHPVSMPMPSPTPSRRSSSSSASSASTFNERSALLDSARSPSGWGAVVGVEVARAIPEDDQNVEHHHELRHKEEEEGRIHGWRLAITL